MNKTCARCEKTVYPTEELKCLDKVWHKGCFKCQECGMTLNMRTYKGYGKLPYCESHVPKAKHTTMAETPELKRIAENTKLQSNVKYHADFEKSKGKFTQVADDPETLRIKANTRIISNVAYHGDLEKKAQMEKQRQINENGELVEVPSENYHQQIDNYATEMLPSAAPPPHLPPKNHYHAPTTHYQPPTTHYTHNAHYNNAHFQNPHYQNSQPQYPQNSQYQPQNHQAHTQRESTHQQVQSTHQQVQSTHHQELQNAQHRVQNPPQTQHVPQNPQYQYSGQYQQERGYAGDQRSEQYKKYDDYQYQYEYQNQNQYQGAQYQYGAGGQPKIGRIQDYDPVSDGPRAPPNTQRASATLIYNSTNDGKRGSLQQASVQQGSRPIGRVTDLDPLAADHAHQGGRDAHQGGRDASQGGRDAHQGGRDAAQNVYIAMYDYEATDSDEVSFREGDYISNVTSIDEGWMTGQVLRTGRTGMLPANYVEQVNARP